MMTPEQLARLEIDRQLIAAGWIIQDVDSMDIHAGLGMVVRNFSLETGIADYFIYLRAKGAGVIEAKPKGHTLTGVEIQSAKYTVGLPEHFPAWYRPLPFAYESTGVETRFTNGLDPEPCSRQVFTFHRPEELLRLLEMDQQLRSRLHHMPPVMTERLWAVQLEAILGLEKSLAHQDLRALIQMATGSGKTYTAASIAHRLIKFAKAKRILFLVDRNNLGKQTLNEFQAFQSPYSRLNFTEEYVVHHLHRNDRSCREGSHHHDSAALLDAEG